MLNRRDFLQRTAAGSLTALAGGAACSGPNGQASGTPLFLAAHDETYAADPRQATLDWFRQANLGLSVRYGVYAQLGRGDFVQFDDKIPPSEYLKLKETFNADHFDAGRITDLALEAGASYINFSARAPDSFCLFRTNTTDFCSLNSPARRDLVGEMADACRATGLGLFLSYSYALDWNHPYFYSRDSVRIDWPYARPAYDETPPEYRLERDEDFLEYLQFIDEQLAEILYRYEPLAGLWLYPVMGYYSRPDLFLIEQSYQRVREASPGALIGFGEGANGQEDFTTYAGKPGQNLLGGALASAAWVLNVNKPKEVFLTLQPDTWGYDKRHDGQHRGPEQLLSAQEKAAGYDANLLLNTGLLPNGAVHPEDERTLTSLAGFSRQSSAELRFPAWRKPPGLPRRDSSRRLFGTV
jgi:alpha-L-fucosidase